MANYISTSRTNYFQVTDEEKYMEIRKGLYGLEDTVMFWDEVRSDGKYRHSFGCYSTIEYTQPYQTLAEYFAEYDKKNDNDRPELVIAMDCADELPVKNSDIQTRAQCEQIAKELKIWSRTETNGEVVLFVSETPEAWNGIDLSNFFKKMQEILPEGEALIFREVGHEKLRYLTALATVVTRDSIDYIDMDRTAIEVARKRLSNPDYTSDSNY